MPFSEHGAGIAASLTGEALGTDSALWPAERGAGTSARTSSSVALETHRQAPVLDPRFGWISRGTSRRAVGRGDRAGGGGRASTGASWRGSSADRWRWLGVAMPMAATLRRARSRRQAGAWRDNETLASKRALSESGVEYEACSSAVSEPAGVSLRAPATGADDALRGGAGQPTHAVRGC